MNLTLPPASPVPVQPAQPATPLAVPGSDPIAALWAAAQLRAGIAQTAPDTAAVAPKDLSKTLKGGHSLAEEQALAQEQAPLDGLPPADGVLALNAAQPLAATPLPSGAGSPDLSAHPRAATIAPAQDAPAMPGPHGNLPPQTGDALPPVPTAPPAVAQPQVRQPAPPSTLAARPGAVVPADQPGPPAGNTVLQEPAGPTGEQPLTALATDPAPGQQVVPSASAVAQAVRSDERDLAALIARGVQAAPAQPPVPVVTRTSTASRLDAAVLQAVPPSGAPVVETAGSDSPFPHSEAAPAQSGSPAPAPVNAQPPQASPPVAPSGPSQPPLAAQAAPVPSASLTSASGVEQAIGQIAELRDLARSARPEMTVRHGDFGDISVRIEPGRAAALSASPADWRAILSARDPGFIPAVQAALAGQEGAAAASGASAQSGQQQSGSQSQQSGAQTGFSQGGFSQGGFAPGSGQGEPRYGSSPGGAQGSRQPSSGEEGAAKQGHPSQRGAHSDDPGGDPGALYA